MTRREDAGGVRLVTAATQQSGNTVRLTLDQPPKGIITINWASHNDGMGAGFTDLSADLMPAEPFQAVLIIPFTQLDEAQFFVRQQYLDFLEREPDPAGLEYWTNQINLCGTDAACIQQSRINVAAAFFIEQEFQQTGYFVYRLYRASFGSRPYFSQFVADRSRVIGGAGLEAGKQALLDDWVQRPQFLLSYPASLTNEQFVYSLYNTAGLQSFTAERDREIAAMNAGETRAQVLGNVIEMADFKQRTYNSAFVLMQYFDYLRRDPDDGGYLFWLDVLNNKVPGNYRGMVCSFITSTEYQLRFGQFATRSNKDCS